MNKMYITYALIKKLINRIFVFYCFIITAFINNNLSLAQGNNTPTISGHTINIAITIKPIYNLAAAIIADVNTTNLTLLLHGNFSPHDYNLKLSDVKLINKADLVIWVGDQLEFFLIKLLTQTKFNNKLLTLQDLPQLNKLNFRDSNYLDEHIWLSPYNAGVILDSITKKLSMLDPSNAKKYISNKKKTLIKLKKLNVDIKNKLKKLHHKQYLVFHDAYQYFEKAYNLRQPIVINSNPSDSLGVQRILTIRDLIVNQNVKCLFTEPQFSSKALDSLLKSKDLNGKLKIGILDPLGSDRDLGADGYLLLIKNLANEFHNCFSN